MNELIELNGAELAAKKLGFSFSLKELSDKFNLEHKNLKRDFEQMINSLDEQSFSLLNFERSKFETKTGRNTIRTFDTYILDVKTTVWLLSKFDHNLRAKLVSYAFDRLESAHNKEVKQLESRNTKLNKEIANKMFNETDDGYMSVSKIKRLLNTDLSVSDIFDILEENGDIETKLVTTKKRVLTSFNGIEDEGKSPRFKLDYVTRLIEENE